MKVVTYWSNVGLPYPDKLADRWLESWHAHGFEPVIAGTEDVEQHPRYPDVLFWAATSPTINDRMFEAACWLRWCAYATHSPALFADLDVMNFGLKPEQVPVGDFEYLGAATVYATQVGIEKFIDFMPRSQPYTLSGELHISDLDAMQQFVGYRDHGLCDVCAKPDKPLVHFGNAYVKPEWRHNERWQAVDEMKQSRKVL